MGEMQATNKAFEHASDAHARCMTTHKQHFIAFGHAHLMMAAGRLLRARDEERVWVAVDGRSMS